MTFCNIEQCKRIERAEQELLASACDNVRRRLPDLYAMPVSGGLAAFTEPGSPLNKVIGLGFQGFDEVEWPLVEKEHKRRGASVQVEIATLADPIVAKWLTGRGYELVGVENVLGRPLAPGEVFSMPGGITIETSPAEQIDAWLDVMVTGFAAPDVEGVPAHAVYERAVLERVIRDFAAARGVTRYLARREGELAGGGTMRVHDGIAQLCGAATLPAHRRRGVQTALLMHRLSAAARGGCSIAVVTTQPGSKSQENVQRRGFDLLYSRNVLLGTPS